MLYVELQHHKVTPYPSTPLFFRPLASSLWLTTKYAVTLPSTIQPRVLIKNLIFGSLTWFNQRTRPQKSASCLNRWFDITDLQVKAEQSDQNASYVRFRLVCFMFFVLHAHHGPAPRLPIPPLRVWQRIINSCVQHVNEMRRDRAAVSMPGWDIMKHAQNTCFQFLTHFSVSSNQWCS